MQRSKILLDRHYLCCDDCFQAKLSSRSLFSLFPVLSHLGRSHRVDSHSESGGAVFVSPLFNSRLCQGTLRLYALTLHSANTPNCCSLGTKDCACLCLCQITYLARNCNSDKAIVFSGSPITAVLVSLSRLVLIWNWESKKWRWL